MPKSEKEVMEQMKKGLFSMPEERNIQTPDQGAGSQGGGRTQTKAKNRKS